MEEKPKESKVYYKGSCACKRITYDSFAWPREPTICHCVPCKKLSGAAYQVFTHGDSKSFIFYDNHESLRYEGLPTEDIGGIRYVNLTTFAKRAFCASCNTPLAMIYRHAPEETAVTVGSVDEESFASEDVREAMRPIQHIFVSQKSWWLNIDGDGLKQVDTMSQRYLQKIADWKAANNA